MQPIAVADAARAVLAAVERPADAFPSVFDLVGPEAVSYAALLERLARVARALGRRADLRVREVPIDEADRRARAGGYQGMLPDELDCLLCDEVVRPGPARGAPRPAAHAARRRARGGRARGVKVPGLRHRSPPIEADVAVVGSGLPALAAALELSRRGARVVVLGTGARGAAPRPRPRPARPRAAVRPGRPRPRPLRGPPRLGGRVREPPAPPRARRRGPAGLRLRPARQLPARRATAPRRRSSRRARTCCATTASRASSSTTTCWRPASTSRASPARTGRPRTPRSTAALLLGALGDAGAGGGGRLRAGARPGPPRRGGVRRRSRRRTAPSRAGAGLVATDGAAAGLVPELRPLLRPAAPARLRARPAGGGGPARRPSAPPTAASPGRAERARSSCAGTGPAEKRVPDRLEAFATRVPVDLASARRWDGGGRGVRGRPAARGPAPGPPARGGLRLRRPRRPGSPSPRRAGWRTRSSPGPTRRPSPCAPRARPGAPFEPPRRSLYALAHAPRRHRLHRLRAPAARALRSAASSTATRTASRWWSRAR